MTAILTGPPGDAPPLRHRIISAVVLALFCLATYDFCNFVAASRNPSRCLAAEWEFGLPQINWMVVPYWTIDIMVVVTPVLARRYDEWRTLLRRMFWAFLIACSFFLILPCRCGYERSIPDDWTAILFRLLHATDLPFNQAPSLHICEAIIVAPVILARLARPVSRAALIAWLILGSLATVFTYQHHGIDVITGAALGFAILKFIPRR